MSKIKRQEASKITTIIFDLSEVLLPGLYSAKDLVESRTGIPAQEFTHRDAETHDKFLQLMRGPHDPLISESSYLCHFISGTNWEVTPEELGDLIRENFLRDLEDSALEIARALKYKYRLVLLSDHVKEWYSYIDAHRSKDLDMFDDKIISCNIGMLKRDPGTFRIVLDTLEVKPDECIFIDDSETNIDLAAAEGINTILYTGSISLKASLKTHDIKL